MEICVKDDIKILNFSHNYDVYNFVRNNIS